MDTFIMPIWASQVKRETISKLYSMDAMGIFDEELVDDVAFAMLARAESIVKVTIAHGENILDCPSCTSIIQGDGLQFVCECGWSITRPKLHATYKRKQLVGGAAMPVIEKAIKSFPEKGTYAEKIFWIDSLIHAFHGELNAQYEKTELAYRPVARNFIEGSLQQVVELIFNLAYGDNPRLAKNREEWVDKLKKSYVSEHITGKYF